MIRTPVLQAFPEQPPYMNPSTAFAHSPSSSPSCLPSASWDDFPTKLSAHKFLSQGLMSGETKLREDAANS